ncbi:transposase [Streptomyces hawaiiensis]|uniref:Transposase n=2 Tax=Streptomyces hawaiiensis TaxID=67305 RepID=A0A6G5R7A6_9ACTN|nr:transposase [Streptomyces hawaiiensis]
MTAAVLDVGSQVRFEDRSWTVVMLEGARARLVDSDNSPATVLVSYLFAAPDFELVGAARPQVPPFGLLEELPVQARERAEAWERHVCEVETGLPVPGQGGVPRAEFDPAQRTVAEREEAKAAELTVAGQQTSAVTVRRMRARYREKGLWGLVDQRTARRRSVVGRADERVVAAITQVLEAQRERSSGTLSRLRRMVGWVLEETHGPGAVEVPPVTTFNRLVHALADGHGLLGSAAQQRRRTSRPAPPFTPTVALRPGELVMLDSTPLDVLVVLAEGVTGSVELSIALDVATRSICAAVVRPVGTRSVDAAVLLAQMVTPMRMRPGWETALAMSRSVIPYERLVSLDARLEGAAARPVIMPETVVVDQGAVFVSHSFIAACESLGVSVQPAPPANGPAKGHVERTFRTIGDRFSQYVAGYSGSDVTRRGTRVEDEACWTLAQVQDLLDEWLVTDWQHRPHASLRHPLAPKLALSPNEMWGALVGVTGYIPVPLSADDYIELMPIKRVAINDYGIRFDYRTYDHKVLNPHRSNRSGAPDGRWEVHHNPYDPHQIWVRLPTGWEEVPWIHRGCVSLPFTDFTWQHVRAAVERRGDRVEHERQLAQALDRLLRRASNGAGTRREQTVAARASAAASLARPAVPQAAPDPVAAPTLSYGLVGAFTPLEEEDQQGETGFEDGWDEDDDLPGPADVDEPAGDEQPDSSAKVPRPSRIYDAYQEAAQW